MPASVSASGAAPGQLPRGVNRSRLETVVLCDSGDDSRREVSLTGNADARRVPRAALLALSIISFVGFVSSALAVVSLAVLRPELSISNHPISEYAHGPYSWVQFSVFLVVGFASLTLAAAVRLLEPRQKWPRLTQLMLGLWGVGMIVAGMVDVEDQVFATDQGVVHRIVVELAFGSLLGAMVLMNHLPLVGRRHALGTSHVWTLVGTTALVLTAMLDGGRWYGLAQRLLAGTAVMWLAMVAIRLRRAGLSGLASHDQGP